MLRRSHTRTSSTTTTATVMLRKGAASRSSFHVNADAITFEANAFGATMNNAGVPEAAAMELMLICLCSELIMLTRHNAPSCAKHMNQLKK